MHEIHDKLKILNGGYAGAGCWVNPVTVAEQLKAAGQELVSKHKPDVDKKLTESIEAEFKKMFG